MIEIPFIAFSSQLPPENLPIEIRALGEHESFTLCSCFVGLSTPGLKKGKHILYKPLIKTPRHKYVDRQIFITVGTYDYYFWRISPIFVQGQAVWA